MKQIIAIIPSEKVSNIIKELENHVGGFSVWPVKGTGKGHLAARVLDPLDYLFLNSIPMILSFLYPMILK